ncbi:nucleotidyltransferase domain-containing protein [Streptomyces sp. NPDC052225]|uniref:nucleotidyltransferase domain-containing protein n=1 Tax=Streptomyces sp. NPDC052225 TaxID=3154949 RepID=UPI003430FEA3
MRRFTLGRASGIAQGCPRRVGRTGPAIPPPDALTCRPADPDGRNTPPRITPETAALLDQARRLLTERHPEALGAVLGGSTARGRATATSDLDPAVLLPTRTRAAAR